MSEPVTSEPDVSPGPWDRILVLILSVVALYGALMVVAGSHVVVWLFEPLGFGPGAAGVVDGARLAYVRFMLTVLGAVLVGWMLTLIAIARGPLRRREPWAWRAILVAVIAWFVLDTGASIALNVYAHALFNVPFFASLILPLAMIRREVKTP